MRTETGTRNESPGRVFLRSALEAREDLRRQQERVAGLECRCRRVTAGLDPAPGGRGEGPERLWALLADARSELARLEQEALSRYKAVEAAIGRVPDETGREVLRLRYLRGLTWPAIQLRVGRPERTVYRLHSAAAAEVERLLWQGKRRPA